MKKQGKHISEQDRELLERRRDRRATYVLALATAIGPSFAVVLQFVLNAI